WPCIVYPIPARGYKPSGCGGKHEHRGVFVVVFFNRFDKALVAEAPGRFDGRAFVGFIYYKPFLAPLTCRPFPFVGCNFLVSSPVFWTKQARIGQRDWNIIVGSTGAHHPVLRLRLATGPIALPCAIGHAAERDLGDGLRA